MARFRGTILGKSRGISRTGTATSGFMAQIDGLNSGVRVVADADENRDMFHIYQTIGSKGVGYKRLIGWVTTNQEGFVVFVSA